MSGLWATNLTLAIGTKIVYNFTVDKLSVIVVRRDYMCAAVQYSPGVYRFMTNVVVYALTHGSISDYSGYVPEDTLAKRDLPTRAPEAAKIGAVE